MATLYPTTGEHDAIEKAANAGDTSAKKYLALLDACTDTLEASNGISLARGLLGEHNDVYGEAIDDALAVLFPAIWECVKDAGGWESLQYYLPPDAPNPPVQVL